MGGSTALSTGITTEMAGFEWAEAAADPRGRSRLTLVK